jgi:hypothetical protein
MPINLAARDRDLFQFAPFDTTRSPSQHSPPLQAARPGNCLSTQSARFIHHEQSQEYGSVQPQERRRLPKTLIRPCLPLQVLGWSTLIAVAGVSFYFAKQSINERRRQQDITGERPSARLDCEWWRILFVT